MGYRDEIRGDVVRAATEPGALHLIVGQLGRAFDVEPRLQQRIVEGDTAVRTELVTATERLGEVDDRLDARVRTLEKGGSGAIDALRKEFETRLAELRKKLMEEVRSLVAEQIRKELEPRLQDHAEKIRKHEQRLDDLEAGRPRPPKSA